MEFYDAMMEAEAASDEQAKPLMAFSEIGPKSATVLLATPGDPGMYCNGREWTASIGLVPRQLSTGGKSRLPGIPQCEDRYRHWLPIYGSRSVVNQIDPMDQTDARSRWMKNRLTRRYGNVVVVVLAKWMVRTAWGCSVVDWPLRRIL